MQQFGCLFPLASVVCAASSLCSEAACVARPAAARRILVVPSFGTPWRSAVGRHVLAKRRRRPPCHLIASVDVVSLVLAPRPCWYSSKCHSSTPAEGIVALQQESEGKMGSPTLLREHSFKRGAASQPARPARKLLAAGKQLCSVLLFHLLAVKACSPSQGLFQP